MNAKTIENIQKIFFSVGTTLDGIEKPNITELTKLVVDSLEGNSFFTGSIPDEDTKKGHYVNERSYNTFVAHPIEVKFPKLYPEAILLYMTDAEFNYLGIMDIVRYSVYDIQPRIPLLDLFVKYLYSITDRGILKTSCGLRKTVNYHLGLFFAEIDIASSNSLFYLHHDTMYFKDLSVDDINELLNNHAMNFTYEVTPRLLCGVYQNTDILVK